MSEQKNDDGLKKALESYFEPIGRLVVRFSHLESMLLTLAIGTLKCPPDITVALFAEMSFSKRLDALSSIAPFTIGDKTLCEEFREVIAALSKAEDHRNIILHTLWTATPTGRLFRMKPTAKRKHGFKTNLHGASLDQIRASTKEIEDAANQLAKFIKKLEEKGLMQVRLFT